MKHKELLSYEILEEKPDEEIIEENQPNTYEDYNSESEEKDDQEMRYKTGKMESQKYEEDSLVHERAKHSGRSILKSKFKVRSDTSVEKTKEHSIVKFILIAVIVLIVLGFITTLLLNYVSMVEKPNIEFSKEHKEAKFKILEEKAKKN